MCGEGGGTVRVCVWGRLDKSESVCAVRCVCGRRGVAYKCECVMNVECTEVKCV